MKMTPTALILGSLAILAAVVLSEQPPAAIFLGGPMILLGIAWAARTERRPTSPTPAPEAR